MCNFVAVVAAAADSNPALSRAPSDSAGVYATSSEYFLVCLCV